MVNSRCRRSDVGSSRSSFTVKEPHFFKIITPSVVQQRKLKIPRKFMSKYGKNLANLVFLKVPSGAVWRVELVSSNEDVWLCNGWEGFTEYYSIRLWHFLAFRYDGNSSFHVLIFDMTASEIEYPISATHGDHQANINHNGNSQVPETEDVEVDDSVEILEDFQTYQKKREGIPKRDEIEKDVSIEILDGSPRRRSPRKPASYRADIEKDVSIDILDGPPVADFPSCKTVRTNVTCKMESTSNLQPLPDFQSSGLKLPNPKTDVKLHCLTREIKKECTGGVSQIPARKQSATPNAKFRALQRARDFKSENPFYTVYIQASYVSRKSGLNIQRDFGRKYLFGEQNNVILRVSDGREWSVKCYRNVQ